VPATFQISFHVSANEPGQLVLTRNGDGLLYTVNGRATGTSQIVGTALTITPITGGSRSFSSSLTVFPTTWPGRKPASSRRLI